MSATGRIDPHCFFCGNPAGVIAKRIAGKYLKNVYADRDRSVTTLGWCVAHFPFFLVSGSLAGEYVYVDCSEDCNMIRGHEGECTWLDL